MSKSTIVEIKERGLTSINHLSASSKSTIVEIKERGLTAKARPDARHIYNSRN